jgi:hypothetical protein
MSRRRARDVFFWLATFVFAAGSAAAHAPPEATGIWWMANGAHERNIVRTNRGLIVSEDGGKTFRLLCNDAFGASLTEVAPLATTSTGRVLVATYAGGLFVASPDLCGFSPVSGPLSTGTNVVGLEVSPAANATMFAIVSRDGSDDHLLSSTDDGVTWRAPSLVEDFLFTLRVAPSDEQRLYASSLHAGDGAAPVYRVLASADGGQHFRSTEVPLNDSEIGVSVLAVDPADADRVFLHTVAGDPTLPERLLRSDDGGQHFVDVVSLLGPLVAATSADGVEIWIGGGDAVLRSRDHGMTFGKAEGAGLSLLACLAVHDGRLFACGLMGDAFGVFVSDDQAVSFSPYLRFPDVTAPLACGADSSAGQVCPQRFEDWRIEQGLPAPVADAGAPTSTPRDAAIDADATDAAPPPVVTRPATDGSGCACSLGAPPTPNFSPRTPWVAAAMLWGAKRRARRSRRRT